MSRLAQAAAAIVVVGLISAGPAVGFAQRPRPGYGGANVPKEDVKISGTIRAMQAGLVQVENETGEKWIVKMPSRGQGVTVVGSGTREWLEHGARGLMVRFVGSFDKSGAAKSPVTDLLVFTPRQWGGEEYKIGVYPEGASAELKGLFAGEEDKRPAPQVRDYRVVGQLLAVGKDAISVAAGGARVSASLAEKLHISVNMGDIRYAQVGDKIEVDGWHLPMQKGQVFANRMTITLASPLGSKPSDSEKRETKAKVKSPKARK